MGYFDYKNQAVSSYSIGGTTAMAANVTGTAVDLATRNGAMVLFGFGTATAGTGVIAPWLHESADASSWGTVAAADVTSTRHGSLIGTTAWGTMAASPQAGSYLMGYTGNKRYIRAFIQAGGALLGGTAVGGTSAMPVCATVISFTSGIQPSTGT